MQWGGYRLRQQTTAFLDQPTTLVILSEARSAKSKDLRLFVFVVIPPERAARSGEPALSEAQPSRTRPRVFVFAVVYSQPATHNFLVNPLDPPKST